MAEAKDKLKAKSSELKAEESQKQTAKGKKKEEKLTANDSQLSAEVDEKEILDGNIQENSQPASKTDDQAGQEVAVEESLELEAESPEQQREEADAKATAKAGKRSSKALKETEEKQAKEERKAHVKDETADTKPKAQQKPPRTRLERRGKNFRKAAELIEEGKQYSLAEAADLAVKTGLVKFDATVELHVNLAVDPRQADQNVRGTVALPAGTGKSIRIAVVAEADDAEKAKKAGADIAGSDEILGQLEKGIIDFDILIATPASMAKLGKYARVLGPKGLMPNPKSGTVAADVSKAVSEAKAGRVEYRVDSTGIIHLGLGKVSFGKEKLLENMQSVMTSIRSAKPASVKGAYIKAIHVTTSMGPSIIVATAEV